LDPKPAARALARLDANAPAHVLGYLAHDSQPDAGSLVLFVEALKDAKQPMPHAVGNAYPVIFEPNPDEIA
jgi:hypothetical protein